MDESIIRGNLHIIAGNPAYENTDRILRLGSNWPIVGAGNSFATEPGAVGNYAINGQYRKLIPMKMFGHGTKELRPTRMICRKSTEPCAVT